MCAQSHVRARELQKPELRIRSKMDWIRIQPLQKPWPGLKVYVVKTLFAPSMQYEICF